ncbi:MAG: hypothetical protein AAGF15_04445 [Pseudomonadota bacterium]
MEHPSRPLGIVSGPHGVPGRLIRLFGLLVVIFLAVESHAVARIMSPPFLGGVSEASQLARDHGVPKHPRLTFSEDVLAFDKPSGRIIMLQARGVDTVDAVAQFYCDSLGALGWEQLSPRESAPNGCAEASTLVFQRVHDNGIERLSLMLQEGRKQPFVGALVEVDIIIEPLGPRS